MGQHRYEALSSIRQQAWLDLLTEDLPSNRWLQNLAGSRSASPTAKHKKHGAVATVPLAQLGLRASFLAGKPRCDQSPGPDDGPRAGHSSKCRSFFPWPSPVMFWKELLLDSLCLLPGCGSEVRSCPWQPALGGSPSPCQHSLQTFLYTERPPLCCRIWVTWGSCTLEPPLPGCCPGGCSLFWVALGVVLTWAAMCATSSPAPAGLQPSCLPLAE